MCSQHQPKEVKDNSQPGIRDLARHQTRSEMGELGNWERLQHPLPPNLQLADAD
jgi:hypothetical protein